jgi:hypothetical protein
VVAGLLPGAIENASFSGSPARLQVTALEVRCLGNNTACERLGWPQLFANGTILSLEGRDFLCAVAVGGKGLDRFACPYPHASGLHTLRDINTDSTHGQILFYARRHLASRG